MGCNGVYGYGLFGNGFENPYLPMAGYLTASLRSCPANIWDARNWTQAGQSWTHIAAYPYGFNFNFTGRRNQYYVANPFDMPYQTALGLQTGQLFSGVGVERLKAGFEDRNKRFCVNLAATRAASNLQQAKSIGDCKDKDYMKAEENKALRDEVIAVEKKAEDLLKQFDEAMKDADKLSTSELDAKVTVYYEAAKTLVEKSDDLYERVKKAEKAYSEAKVKEAEAKAKKAADKAGSGDGAGAGNGAGAADGAGDGAGAADGAGNEDPVVQPPEVKTSASKTEITTKGTEVKCKKKGSTGNEAITGPFYEYKGKIYKIKDNVAEPQDVTDKVEKITT